MMSVAFLTAPSVPPAEALPQLARVPPEAVPEVLIARAATAKEWLGILAKLGDIGIPLRQVERRAGDPLVALWTAGSRENPEPLAIVGDFLLLGGGWSLLGRLLGELARAPGRDRMERLLRLSAVPGVYVPSFYAVEYGPEGPIDRVVSRPGVAFPVGLEGGAPFPTEADPGYRRYFVGEPSGDVERIAEGIKHERHQERVRLRRQPAPLSVSLRCLVPWPWGPFQWAPMATEERLKDEIRRASRMLGKIPGVRATHDQPKWALLEGVLQMGDRRAGELLLLARRVGWDRARVASPLNPAFILHRSRPKAEVLPWDHVSWGLDREALWQEFERLVRGAGVKR